MYNLVLLYKNRQDIKMFLEILLSLLTVAGFGIFAIRPTVVTIANLITEIKSKQEIAQLLDTKINNLATAQQLYEQNRDTITLFETSIPNKPTPENYIGQLEAIVSKNSLTLENMSLEDLPLVGSVGAPIEKVEEEGKPTPRKIPSDATEMTISVGVSGTYQDLVAFLKDLESHRRPILIDSTSFDSIVAESDEKIVLTIKGRLAYIK